MNFIFALYKYTYLQMWQILYWCLMNDDDWSPTVA